MIIHTTDINVTNSLMIFFLNPKLVFHIDVPSDTSCYSKKLARRNLPLHASPNIFCLVTTAITLHCQRLLFY